MKKILVLGMVAVMALAMLVGCGEDGQVPGAADPQQQTQSQEQQSGQTNDQTGQTNDQAGQTNNQNDQNQASQNQQNQQSKQGVIAEDGVVMDPSDADLIGEERAKQIVLDRVDGASEQDVKKFDLDYDDGRWVYEGEIYKGDFEYEFEINAESGDVMSWEKDHIYD